jgi:predicted RNA polymerase sigma factor
VLLERFDRKDEANRVFQMASETSGNIPDRTELKAQRSPLEQDTKE